jgi:hypothetical protein
MLHLRLSEHQPLAGPETCVKCRKICAHVAARRYYAVVLVATWPVRTVVDIVCSDIASSHQSQQAREAVRDTINVGICG